MRHVSTTLAFVLLSSITTVEAGAQSSTITRAAYDSTMRKFVALVKRGADVPGMMALYAPNATWVDSDGSVNVGRAQIERLLRGYLAAMTFKDYSIETTTFRADGPVAYAAGVEHVKAVDKKSGKPMEATARFLVIMRAQPDGRATVEYGLEAPVPEKPGTP